MGQCSRELPPELRWHQGAAQQGQRELRPAGYQSLLMES